MKSDLPEPSNQPLPADAPRVVSMASLALDVEKQDGGSWEKIPGMEGAELCVRSLDYPPYKLAVAAHNRAHSRKYRGEATIESEAEDYRIRGELLARHILLGWRGFDEDYDPTVARARLSSREWQRLREFTVLLAMQVGEREIEFAEKTEKN